jgi:hypothetical protein
MHGYKHTVTGNLEYGDGRDDLHVTIDMYVLDSCVSELKCNIVESVELL